MQLFHYKAMDAAGRVRRGRLSAAGAEALERHLARLGLDLIACRPARQRGPLRSGASRRDLIHFCLQLQHLIGAGVPLMQALVDLRDSADDLAFRSVVTGVVERIAEGNSFSGALAEFPQVFDPLFTNLVRAGEQSGELPEVLGELAEGLKWQDETLARARRVLTYPLFVAVTITGVLLFLMLYLVPQLGRFITSMEGTLPLHTRALLAVSGFLMQWWWLVLLLPAAVAVSVALAARGNEGLRLKLDESALRLWVVGELLHKLTLARFARLFGLMYRAGIPVLEILRVAADAVPNRAVRRAIGTAREGITQGMTIALAFESAGLFPPLVLRMIGVGEATGALDTALANIGYFFDRDVRERIDRLEVLIGPAMTVVLGLLLGWIMLAVLGPLYDLLGKIAT
jgi:type IV pilus assembly protein PilC